MPLSTECREKLSEKPRYIPNWGLKSRRNGSKIALFRCWRPTKWGYRRPLAPFRTVSEGVFSETRPHVRAVAGPDLLLASSSGSPGGLASRRRTQLPPPIRLESLTLVLLAPPVLECTGALSDPLSRARRRLRLIGPGATHPREIRRRSAVRE